jgi:hypothetical protein
VEYRPQLTVRSSEIDTIEIVNIGVESDLSHDASHRLPIVQLALVVTFASCTS